MFIVGQVINFDDLKMLGKVKLGKHDAGTEITTFVYEWFSISFKKKSLDNFECTGNIQIVEIVPKGETNV